MYSSCGAAHSHIGRWQFKACCKRIEEEDQQCGRFIANAENAIKKARSSSTKTKTNRDGALGTRAGLLPASRGVSARERHRLLTADRRTLETVEEIGDANKEVGPTGTLAPDEGADLPGYELTAADRRLDSVYGDHIHSNDGTHLNDGIADDKKW